MKPLFTVRAIVVAMRRLIVELLGETDPSEQTSMENSDAA